MKKTVVALSKIVGGFVLGTLAMRQGLYFLSSSYTPMTAAIGFGFLLASALMVLICWSGVMDLRRR